MDVCNLRFFVEFESCVFCDPPLEQLNQFPVKLEQFVRMKVSRLLGVNVIMGLSVTVFNAVIWCVISRATLLDTLLWGTMWINQCYWCWNMSVILFQGPQPEDRAQVSAEDVRLPNSLSTALSTQDTQIVSLISAYVASSVYCTGVFVCHVVSLFVRHPYIHLPISWLWWCIRLTPFNMHTYYSQSTWTLHLNVSLVGTRK